MSKKEDYIDSLIEKVNHYTKNSLIQVELKHKLDENSERAEFKQVEFPSISSSLFSYRKLKKIKEAEEVLDKKEIVFKEYEVEVNSIFGYKIESFILKVVQNKGEKDLSLKEILNKIESKNYSFEYFAKRYEDYIKYTAFDGETGLVFYERYFYIK